MPAKRSPSFQLRLHEMLDRSEEEGFVHIVSWMPCGTAFKIFDQEAIVPILRRFFRQTRFKSFVRQLQIYEFSRICRGIHKGKCSHHLFVRDKLYLLTTRGVNDFQNKNPTHAWAKTWARSKSSGSMTSSHTADAKQTNMENSTFLPRTTICVADGAQVIDFELPLGQTSLPHFDEKKRSYLPHSATSPSIGGKASSIGTQRFWGFVTDDDDDTGSISTDSTSSGGHDVDAKSDIESYGSVYCETDDDSCTSSMPESPLQPLSATLHRRLRKDGGRRSQFAGMPFYLLDDENEMSNSIVSTTETCINFES